MPKEQLLLKNLREGETVSLKDRITLVLLLSYPAVIAMMTTVVTEYIDAAMVGHIGSEKAASIGLMSSSLWLIGGIVGAFSTGLQIQTVHTIGAGQEKKARTLVRHGIFLSFVFSLILVAAGLLIYKDLPLWLGGSGEIARDASRYALIYVLMLPVMQISRTSNSMIQSSGNTKTAGMIGVLVCLLDVIFNFFLIFGSRTVTFFGRSFEVWGAGLDVVGASLGTMLAELTGMCIALKFLFFGDSVLRQKREDFSNYHRAEFFETIRKELADTLKLAIPVAAETVVMNSAQIMITRIIAPLGVLSIAANSFAITAEAFCYMPGYGVAMAATTLVGQSIGAGRKRLAGQLSYLVTAAGMAVMAGTGFVMYMFAPQIMAILTPDTVIQQMGVEVLRIEAFAEPMFGAAMVVAGVFRGIGNTVFPSIVNLISMWAVRIPLAMFFTSRIGLNGAWIAMCIEIIARGTLFLIMLYVWNKKKSVVS